MKIFLIRHGKTKGNLEKRYTGQSDVNVCTEGINELEIFRNKIIFPKDHDLFTSTLTRTKQTANIYFPKKDCQSLWFMNETDFGDFEGLRYTDLQHDKNYQAWLNDIFNIIPKNGESFLVFKERVITNFVNHLSQLNKDTIYVTHGGVIRIIMSTLVDTNISFFNWNIPNGKGYILSFDDNKISDYSEII